ncbi:MAG: succinate dehydrogenase [Gemmatimonadetes bacterium]|nr:succinate dehydrogenase [Gemmatimonadota bacterium]
MSDSVQTAGPLPATVRTPSAVRPRLGATSRLDAWWLQPLLVALGLGAFGAYSTWAAFQGANYEWAAVKGLPVYLSPFYSPLLTPDWWPLSPALLILWAPLGFRATCYYYRKAYYRAFFLDPPACSVGEARGHRYKGETAFPFILQNVHRYFLYVALVFIGILGYDVVLAFTRWPTEGGTGFGVGLGSLIMLANVVLLTGYTLGCHSLRHVVAGKLDCFSCGALGGARYDLWRGLNVLNQRHMLWAWMSLTSVGLTDLYIRLVASGVWVDPRLL